MRSKAVRILFSSVALLLRNLRRAGTLKKRLLMVKELPTEHEQGSWLSTREADIVRQVPISSSCRRVRNSICATAAMEGSASPRNPIV